MFNDIDKRYCPYCGKSINRDATRCGFCWKSVHPLKPGEGDVVEPNHREAFRLVQVQDCAAIEALLDERDQLRNAVVKLTAERNGSAPLRPDSSR